ncbi:MAG: hypothetical protein M3Q07_18135 [Pseudobdellovibrionaceae bacterium]|nr:hypothetical protein [Pseudobdellovibrionaceae bacterium]
MLSSIDGWNIEILISGTGFDLGGRVEELKRQYALTIIARDTAETQSEQKKSKKSLDWLLHNEKKIKILSQQIRENNVLDIDPHKLLGGSTGEYPLPSRELLKLRG